MLHKCGLTHILWVIWYGEFDVDIPFYLAWAKVNV